MRQLIYIPVIHTEVDMGSVAGSLKEAYLNRYGKEKWASHVKAIESMWKGIQRKIDDLDLNYSCTKLYQDGLPICGKELQIVNEVAARGSRNHQILLDLIHKGCTIIGTESPQLLLKEYHMIKKALGNKNYSKHFLSRLFLQWVSHQLLAKRDRFIARRIAETLKDGETGILFIGIQHEVDRFFSACQPSKPSDFKVKYLIHRLPFQYESRFPLPT